MAPLEGAPGGKKQTLAEAYKDMREMALKEIASSRGANDPQKTLDIATSMADVALNRGENPRTAAQALIAQGVKDETAYALVLAWRSIRDSIDYKRPH
jgi:uncharacterized protein YutE (UPF0331/DUF86 family)